MKQKIQNTLYQHSKFTHWYIFYKVSTFIKTLPEKSTDGIVVKCTLNSLPRWSGNLLYQHSKTVPVNGLAWLADLWPAKFTSTNKTNCIATWGANLNYSLLYKLQVFGNSLKNLKRTCNQSVSAWAKVHFFLYSESTEHRTVAAAISALASILISKDSISICQSDPLQSSICLFGNELLCAVSFHSSKYGLLQKPIFGESPNVSQKPIQYHYFPKAKQLVATYSTMVTK